MIANKQRWFMVVAAFCMLAVVGLELGSTLLLEPVALSDAEFERIMIEEGVDEDEREEALDQRRAVSDADDPPGLSIPALASIDVLLMLSIVGLASSLIVPDRVLARVVAPANLVVAFLVILAGIIVFIVTMVLLFLMVGLFLAPPFGTITYLVRWGFFPRGEAQTLLGILLLLKIVMFVFLFSASPRVIKNKGMMAMIGTSVVLQLVIGFLLSVVPLPLVSITDAVGALIVLIVGIIWAIVILVGALIGTIRLLRVSRG